MISGTGSNNGMLIVKLKDWKDRTKKGEDLQSFVAKMYKETAGIKDAKMTFFGRPTLQGFGNAAGFELQIQDQKGGSVSDLNKVTNDFIDKMNQRPEIRKHSLLSTRIILNT
jgi:HAE1 family hydrophobic/amphiphilic exporter-1